MKGKLHHMFPNEHTKFSSSRQLPARLLRDCTDEITTLTLHRKSFTLTNTILTTWKTGKIVPVYQSGDTSKVENYRPISELPILSKVIEKAVHSHVIEFLENNNLLNNFQFRYKKTAVLISFFVGEIRSNGNKGKLNSMRGKIEVLIDFVPDERINIIYTLFL